MTMTKREWFEMYRLALIPLFREWAHALRSH